jgi:hypothetical protein
MLAVDVPAFVLGLSFASASANTIAVKQTVLTDLVGSPVPIPAGAWLFASALGIFGYLGKRKANA